MTFNDLEWPKRTLSCANKKLSCCCDSRSYCVQYILTLFIVSTTCRPLNKKSVCCQTAIIITANSQSAHLSARTLQSAVSAHASESAPAVAPNGTVPTRSPRKKRYNCVPVLGLRFALRFLWCILWLNDTSYSKSVKRDK